jgi:hypothetical protein
LNQNNLRKNVVKSRALNLIKDPYFLGFAKQAKTPIFAHRRYPRKLLTDKMFMSDVGPFHRLLNLVQTRRHKEPLLIGAAKAFPKQVQLSLFKIGRLFRCVLPFPDFLK